MIRTVITPEKQDVSIHIPENYIGKRIEVLLYAIEELEGEENPTKIKTADFRGKLKLSTEQYNDFQLHLKDIRNEWHNDI